MIILLHLFLFLPMLLILPDLFGNPDFIQSRIGIASETLLLIAVYEFIVFRVMREFRFQGRIKAIIFILFITTSLLSTLASIIGFFTPPNFVYSLTRLNYDKLFYFSFVLGVFSLGSLPTTFFKKHYMRLIFVAPLIVLVLSVIIWMLPFEKLYYITREDSVVEYMQFFVLITGAIFAFLLSRKLFSTSKLFFILYLFISIALFATAGDEISWGQRMLGIETPQSMQASNTQGEITFHNTQTFYPFVTAGYVSVGLYGSIISLVLHKVVFRYKAFFLPPPHLFFYFFIPFLFNSYILLGDHELGRFAEICELLLYSGVAVFVEELYVTRKRKYQ